MAIRAADTFDIHNHNHFNNMNQEEGKSPAAVSVQSAARRDVRRAREESRQAGIDRIRFGDGHNNNSGAKGDVATTERRRNSAPIKTIMAELGAAGFADHGLLSELRQRLAGGDERPEEVLGTPGALAGLVGAVLNAEKEQEGSGGSRLAATQVLANLSPLQEADGVQVSRQAGPALVTLLSSGSTRLQEAAAVAIGNLAMAGPRAVKVLANQEALESLAAVLKAPESVEPVRASCLYALYHLLQSCYSTAPRQILDDLIAVCQDQLGRRSPTELPWVLFVLSCNQDLHERLQSDKLISAALDLLTYEIFQKSDSRPLIKTVTPVVRYLSNLCAGPQSEQVCLKILRLPDLLAILVALLGTNFAHLSKESLHWFSNIVNCESLEVQEVLVDLDFLDKMEYHTVQAIHKLDPYLTNVIH